MAIIGFEWLVVVGVVIIFLLFRPRAISDLARSMGQVMAEFKKGQKESKKTGKDEELLVETAEKLGIRTEGKTASQIREEILAKAARESR